MPQRFDENPILNSPYEEPERHWHLDDASRPTGTISEGRRTSAHLVPIPASQRNKIQQQQQGDLGLEDKTKENPIINRIRRQVKKWRAEPPEQWKVTYETRTLLMHWREGLTTPRPFFCQIEATETFIWLNEVAPNTTEGKKF